MYAPFGLTVYWDGSTKAVYSLSPSYENHVCGLCGNADGNFIMPERNSILYSKRKTKLFYIAYKKGVENDFVDRNNNPVPTPTIGTNLTAAQFDLIDFFQWGNSWIVIDTNNPNNNQ